jgi:hypothetical protein
MCNGMDWKLRIYDNGIRLDNVQWKIVVEWIGKG